MHGERWILSSVDGSLYLLGVLLHPTHSSHCYIDTILMNVKILCISSYNALPGKTFSDSHCLQNRCPGSLVKNSRISMITKSD